MPFRPPRPSAAAVLARPSLLDELGRRRWTRLLVEGGATVHESFLAAGLADEVQAYVAPDRVEAPEGLARLAVDDLARRFGWPEATVEPIGRDRLHTVILTRIPA